MNEEEYDAHIKRLIKVENAINKIQQDVFFELYNKDGSEKKTVKAKDSKNIDLSKLKWILVKPKSSKTKSYELCDEKESSLYKELASYIEEHRVGYSDLKYNGYNLRILKNGIIRRKI